MIITKAKIFVNSFHRFFCGKRVYYSNGLYRFSLLASLPQRPMEFLKCCEFCGIATALAVKAAGEVKIELLQ